VRHRDGKFPGKAGDCMMEALWMNETIRANAWHALDDDGII